MENANFVALDFETATITGRMPCQIGIAVVKNGVIADIISKLIHPPHNRYSNKLIGIHGITPYNTKDSPTFDKVWREVSHLFEANFVIAHNISFDLDVLSRATQFYGLRQPVFMGSACTYELTGHNLKDSCNTLGIELDHHNAASDALACAKIFLKHLAGEDVGHRVFIPYSGRSGSKYSTTLKGAILGMDLSKADPSHPLYMKKLCITGEFEKWDRYELAELLKRKGADIKSGLTKTTEFIAVGNDPGQSKMIQVETMKKEGLNISLLTERDIEDLLKI